MLVTLKEALKIAEEKKIAVGAFNAANLESLQAVITGAEELNLPVIMQFAQCHEPWVPLALIGPIMVAEAKKASVPVCVHLDHGETLDYLEKALEIGFTGIMYDGSVFALCGESEKYKKGGGDGRKNRGLRGGGAWRHGKTGIRRGGRRRRRH